MTVTLLDKSLYDVLASLGYDMQFYGVRPDPILPIIRDLIATCSRYGIRPA